MLHKIPRKKIRGFTLIEVMMACFVMAMFLGAVYKLFIGGSKTAGRAQWVNESVDQMSNALTFLDRQIKSSTYPTTLFSDTFFDPCDNPDKSVAAEYYMRVLQVGEPVAPPSSGELKIMSWVVCEPEKPPNPGKIYKNELYLDAARPSAIKKIKLGNLRVKIEAFTFTTNKGSQYARSGNLSLTQIPKETRSRVLVKDVEHIEFLVAGKTPPESPVSFSPVSVKIRTLYPKDEKVFKENSVMATPQVAVDTF
jgi:prepilin-type N-terminal cleavage/methylation domain-containing protein